MCVYIYVICYMFIHLYIYALMYIHIHIYIYVDLCITCIYISIPCGLSVLFDHSFCVVVQSSKVHKPFIGPKP